MAITATNKKTQYDILEEGAYPARIYQIIHIGTVPGFQGKLQNKARITFEFPTEMKVFDEKKGEQPMVLSQDYTLSFNEKAGLRKVIDACDPKALKAVGEDGLVEVYDIEKLLGKSCLVTIIHKASKDGQNTYANIGGCTVLPKGMVCPAQINPSKSLSYDAWDQSFFETLPKFLQDAMKSSDEYRFMTIDKDEVPFVGDGSDINLEDYPA